MTNIEGAPPPSRDDLAAFTAALRDTNRVRVDRNTLWAAWNHIDTGWRGTWRSRLRLASALAQLDADGEIRLPAASGRLWDDALPPLPHSIDIPANRRTRPAVLDTTGEMWVPQMRRWAPAWIRSARPASKLREAAVLINRWLQRTTGTTPARVAREERSLHIFNDEKRLADLAAGALFAPGRLTLGDLHCDVPVGHLRACRLTPRGPVLVLENKATFDSAWRAQRANPNPTYAAILFGSGDAVTSLAHDLHHLDALIGVHPTSCHYAGDVDTAGIEAAASFARAAAATGIPTTMATSLWDAVARAEPTGPDNTADSRRSAASIQSALSLRLPPAVITRLEQRQRVPQERIDRTVMADTSWWQLVPLPTPPGTATTPPDHAYDRGRSVIPSRATEQPPAGDDQKGNGR